MKPVLIKRYRNRKFYNTETKRYITLSGIKQLIADDREIIVIENSTGTDITSTTFSQIVHKISKMHNGILPVRLFTYIVQQAGWSKTGMRDEGFPGINSTLSCDFEITRRVNLLIAWGELTQDVGIEMLEKLIQTTRKFTGPTDTHSKSIIDLMHNGQLPTKDDLTALFNKLDALSLRLETYKESMQAFRKH